jgi:hypothetical protein
MSFFSDSVLAGERSRSVTAEASPRQLRVMTVLTTIFNVMALNGVLVIACLPIVTIPAALRAAMVALDGWRSEGDDRVVRSFVLALRSGRFRHTTLVLGVPLVAAVLAAEEVIYFSRAANAGNAVGIGLGITGLLLALSSIGYLLVLEARQPDLPVTDLWFLAVALVARNLLVASPLLAGELVAGLLVLTRDPSLAVIGIPVLLLLLVQRTALRPVVCIGELIELDTEPLDDREVEL